MRTTLASRASRASRRRRHPRPGRESRPSSPSSVAVARASPGHRVSLISFGSNASSPFASRPRLTRRPPGVRRCVLHSRLRRRSRGLLSSGAVVLGSGSLAVSSSSPPLVTLQSCFSLIVCLGLVCSDVVQLRKGYASPAHLSLFRSCFDSRPRFLDWFSLSSTLDYDFVQEHLTSRGTHTSIDHHVVRHISYLALLDSSLSVACVDTADSCRVAAPRAVDSAISDCFSVTFSCDLHADRRCGIRKCGFISWVLLVDTRR